MATLSTYITDKAENFSTQEGNIETGRVYFYTPATTSNHYEDFYWCAPGAGTARIEIWGSQGSGAQMCCCGNGIAGNPSAYVVKTIDVTGTSWVCGKTGLSCGNGGTLCYRGIGTGACFCYSGTTQSGCLCAQPGDGGRSWCSPSHSPYCCWSTITGSCPNAFPNGVSGQHGHIGCSGSCDAGQGSWGTGFGVTCNTIGTPACAYASESPVAGKDCLVNGGFSCSSFFTCDSANFCYHQYHIRTAAGIYGTCGALVTFSNDHDSVYSQGGTGGYISNFQYALQGASKHPQHGFPPSYCWNGARHCACYEDQGCQAYAPHGIPGSAPWTCNSVRDHAMRGGHGAIRILFKAT